MGGGISHGGITAGLSVCSRHRGGGNISAGTSKVTACGTMVNHFYHFQVNSQLNDPLEYPGTTGIREYLPRDP
jgi:hypothetical protein